MATRFRIRYRIGPALTYCTVFASPPDKDAFEMLGGFSCNHHEFDDLQQELRNSNVQFVNGGSE